eukprot:360719-Chlamydomonas_euryale.AAC.14
MPETSTPCGMATMQLGGSTCTSCFKQVTVVVNLCFGICASSHGHRRWLSADGRPLPPPDTCAYVDALTSLPMAALKLRVCLAVTTAGRATAAAMGPRRRPSADTAAMASLRQRCQRQTEERQRYTANQRRLHLGG